jgi:DNA-binding NtrC family response regulator
MQLNVYYIDDEPYLLEIFSDLFSNDEVKISLFSDPEKLFETVRKNPPDLMFIDNRLPNISGDQIGLCLDQSIPKVLITGDLSVSCLAKFEVIMQKPFKIKEIQAILDKHLQIKKSA